VNKNSSLLTKFLRWRLRHINNKNFVLILSIIIGLASGMAAVIIKNSVHVIRSFLTEGFVKDYNNYLYLAYPLAGIFIVVLIIKFLIKQRVGHGIPTTLYAISKKNSIMKRHNMFSSIITSSLTVGFGGSVGLEGPTVATGASIGSNLGRLLHLNYKSITLLVGCGAAGAMAAIFNAPIAAIVFVLEVIMLDLTMASLIPLLLASVTAVITSNLILGTFSYYLVTDILFHFPLKDPFISADLPFFILLGIITGLVSLYFTKMYFFIEGKFELIKNSYTKVVVGGLSLGLLIFLFPPLFGEGYESINNILSGNYTHILNNSIFYSFKDNMYVILLFLILIVIFKVIATSITFGSGGIGGIFAPTLFMGSMTGFVFAKLFNYFNLKHLSESNFALVGMAGLMAGVLHAPLTAIFLIAEITHGYELFLPLMITASISYITIRYFIPHSVYTMQLAKRGELITHHKDKAVLSRLQLSKVIETDLKTVSYNANLGDLVKVVSQSKRNIFPVVDKENNLLGIILLDDIRNIMFNKAMYDKVHINNLMHAPPAFISSTENMDSVMQKFEQTGAWNLPVIDDDKYVGFVSKSKLFSAYRRLLVQFSEE